MKRLKQTPEINYLLIVLMEECAEITKEASKALRFGLRDRYQDDTPEARLALELNDLKQVWRELYDRGVYLPVSESQQSQKAARLKKAMTYSRKKGML